MPWEGSIVFKKTKQNNKTEAAGLPQAGSKGRAGMLPWWWWGGGRAPGRVSLTPVQDHQAPPPCLSRAFLGLPSTQWHAGTAQDPLNR